MDAENIRKYLNILNEASAFCPIKEPVRASTESSVEEKWGKPTKVRPEELDKYKGWSLAELRKAYNALKAKGPHKKGSPELGRLRELSFAIRAKTGWGKISEKNGCPSK